MSRCTMNLFIIFNIMWSLFNVKGVCHINGFYYVVLNADITFIISHITTTFTFPKPNPSCCSYHLLKMEKQKKLFFLFAISFKSTKAGRTSHISHGRIINTNLLLNLKMAIERNSNSQRINAYHKSRIIKPL